MKIQIVFPHKLIEKAFADLLNYQVNELLFPIIIHNKEW